MTKTNSYGTGRLALLLCLAGLLAFSASSACAADDNTSDAGDPPTRVARISYLDGTVSLQPGGEGDWGAAQRNRPMTIGDKIWSDKDSRAELETGVVTIHLGSMTALSFLNLDQNITQMRLPEGSINFRVREIREGDTFEVDTPNLAFLVKQAGAFRIDVNENGDSTGITVIRGAGQVTANGQTYDIAAGQRGVFNGTDENVQSSMSQAPAADPLDQWANDRDLREQDSVSSRYVPQDTPGTEDLDNNGSWSEEPEVGHVWYPNDVPPDWAPYSNGYWSSIGPWGYTWVGYEPWGFAPYHYGRWGFWGGRWGWCPGPIGYPAVYGPAFVGFLGGGFGFGFGVGFGVGWFPLGWGEPFHPWFRCGDRFTERINVRNTYIRNVSIVHNTNYNNFRYAHDTHAVTATSRSGFAGGQAVNRGAAHITEASLRGAQVTHNLGVTPSRSSAFGAANLKGSVARPSGSIQNRSVMARTTPGSAAAGAHVQTMNTRGLTAGRYGSASANANAGFNRPATNNGNTTRSWNAQGTATDRGRAPQGFGSDVRAGNTTTTRADRPSWAGSTPPASYNRGGGSVSANNTRSYTPPTGNNNRSTYSAPSQPRTYSAPSRTYNAPSRSYGSAPSYHSSAPSSSGGGGGSRGSSGGGSSHSGGGGGSSHGGGGGHPHR